MLHWSRVLLALMLRVVIAQSTLNVADLWFGSLRFSVLTSRFAIRALDCTYHAESNPTRAPDQRSSLGAQDLGGVCAQRAKHGG
jgi:hypothetical protein